MVPYDPGGETDGFTLLELILVISILGILATISVPAFSNFLRDFRLQSYTNKVHSALNNARFTSIAENRAVRVRIQMGSSTQYGDDSIHFEICTKESTDSDDCPGQDYVQAPGISTLKPPEPIIVYSACNNNSEPYGTSTGERSFRYRPNGSAYSNACGLTAPFIQLTYSPVPDEEDERCEFRTIRASSANGLSKIFPFRRNPYESVNESPLADLECND